jgi:hypothetical protein
MLELPTGFKIELWSDPNYEELTAVLYWNDHVIAQMYRDKGVYRIKFDCTDQPPTGHVVADLLEAIDLTQKRLAGDIP